MCRPLLRIILICLVPIAALLAAISFSAAETAGPPGALSAGIILFRIGLLYLAYLCVLLAIDLGPQPTDAKGA